MMSLFDEEQIMKSFIKSERHDGARKTTERLIIVRCQAIAAVNNLDLNDIILSKDKKASLKYNCDINLEQFVSSKRSIPVIQNTP